jgi:hypothetical protein
MTDPDTPGTDPAGDAAPPAARTGPVPNRPDAADIALVATVGPWSNEDHFTPRARMVARALKTWRAARGL